MKTFKRSVAVFSGIVLSVLLTGCVGLGSVNLGIEGNFGNRGTLKNETLGAIQALPPSAQKGFVERLYTYPTVAVRSSDLAIDAQKVESAYEAHLKNFRYTVSPTEKRVVTIESTGTKDFMGKTKYLFKLEDGFTFTAAAASEADMGKALGMSSVMHNFDSVKTMAIKQKQVLDQLKR